MSDFPTQKAHNYAPRTVTLPWRFVAYDEPDGEGLDLARRLKTASKKTRQQEGTTSLTLTASALLSLVSHQGNEQVLIEWMAAIHGQGGTNDLMVSGYQGLRLDPATGARSFVVDSVEVARLENGIAEANFSSSGMTSENALSPAVSFEESPREGPRHLRERTVAWAVFATAAVAEGMTWTPLLDTWTALLSPPNQKEIKELSVALRVDARVWSNPSVTSEVQRAKTVCGEDVFLQCIKRMPDLWIARAATLRHLAIEHAPLPEDVEGWMQRHQPYVSQTLSAKGGKTLWVEGMLLLMKREDIPAAVLQHAWEKVALHPTSREQAFPSLVALPPGVLRDEKESCIQWVIETVHQGLYPTDLQAQCEKGSPRGDVPEWTSSLQKTTPEDTVSEKTHTYGIVFIDVAKKAILPSLVLCATLPQPQKLKRGHCPGDSELAQHGVLLDQILNRLDKLGIVRETVSQNLWPALAGEVVRAAQLGGVIERIHHSDGEPSFETGRWNPVTPGIHERVFQKGFVSVASCQSLVVLNDIRWVSRLLIEAQERTLVTNMTPSPTLRRGLPSNLGEYSVVRQVCSLWITALIERRDLPDAEVIDFCLRVGPAIPAAVNGPVLQKRPTLWGDTRIQNNPLWLKRVFLGAGKKDSAVFLSAVAHDPRIPSETIANLVRMFVSDAPEVHVHHWVSKLLEEGPETLHALRLWPIAQREILLAPAKETRKIGLRLVARGKSTDAHSGDEHPAQ